MQGLNTTWGIVIFKSNQIKTIQKGAKTMSNWSLMLRLKENETENHRLHRSDLLLKTIKGSQLPQFLQNIIICMSLDRMKS